MNGRLQALREWVWTHTPVLVALILIVAGLVVVHATDQSAAHSSARAAADASRASQRLSVYTHANCLGSATSKVAQIGIDWDIYEADLRTAQTSVGHQAAIRGQEADKILTHMKTIAGDRLSVTVAATLPPVLDRIVRHVGFRCPAA